jgi:hypothetical protein
MRYNSLTNRYNVCYCPGQDISFWDIKEKKYKKGVVVTAGGGRVKIKENNQTFWVDADKVK